MFSAIFDFFSSIWQLLSTLLGALGSVGRALLDVLFALVSAILWPVKALGSIFFGTWNVSAPWTPLYFLACTILILALIVLVAWALWVNHLRRKNNH